MDLRLRVVVWIACLVGAATAFSTPVMRVVQPGLGDTNLVRNPGFEQGTTSQFSYWATAPDGYDKGPGEGRDGSQALVCVSADGQGWSGASQQLTMNQTNLWPIIVSGWSRAEGVSGNADAD